jgi:hypothetical protein
MKHRKILVLTALVCLTLLLIPSSTNAATEWDVIYYDDKVANTYLTFDENDTVAVLFTPPVDNFQLSGIRLYTNSSVLSKLCVWVLDANYAVIMQPFDPPDDIGPPPYNINFDAGPIFTSENVSDFYVVVQWKSDDSPKLAVGVDTNTIAGRSYTNHSGSWQQYSSGNIMIHARMADIFGPAFDHVPLQYAIEGKALSISVEVFDEFGVESVILAYRERGSNGTFDTLSFTPASGTEQRGIWYVDIPGENVTSDGLEYYIWATDKGSNQRYYGNASNPFQVEAFQMIIEVPLLWNIIIILGISAAAAVVYIMLPKYEGEDTP